MSYANTSPYHHPLLLPQASTYSVFNGTAASLSNACEAISRIEQSFSTLCDERYKDTKIQIQIERDKYTIANTITAQ